MRGAILGSPSQEAVRLTVPSWPLRGAPVLTSVSPTLSAVEVPPKDRDARTAASLEGNEFRGCQRTVSGASIVQWGGRAVSLIYRHDPCLEITLGFCQRGGPPLSWALYHDVPTKGSAGPEVPALPPQSLLPQGLCTVLGNAAPTPGSHLPLSYPPLTSLQHPCTFSAPS